MSEGVIIDLVPIALDESAHQQQKCRLRLMKIGNQHLHDVIIITRGDNDLRARVEHFEMVGIHPGI